MKRSFAGLALAAGLVLMLPDVGEAVDIVTRDSHVTTQQQRQAERALQPVIRVVHRQPLTTRYVNTSSTRAVDSRRAEQSGVVLRPTPRAYVVKNPVASQQQPAVRNVAPAPQAYQPVRAVQPVYVQPEQPREIVVFVNPRPDPVTDQIGAVRAQPPIARMHDSVEPANHRAIAPLPQPVTYRVNPVPQAAE